MPGMNNTTPLVSVIVPMYNVEEFLSKCVDSLLVQTLGEIEVVLVDDGSPDRCGDIAERYAEKDSRVRVLHRPNGGLGPARNSGMKVARGEYVGFVDSDDWVDRDMYERLYQTAEEAHADIALSQLRVVRNGDDAGRKDHPFAGRVLSGSEEIFELRRSFYGAGAERVVEDPVPVSVCPNIYRRTLLTSNDLKFTDVRSEDKIFNTRAFRAAKCVAVMHGAPYCYRKDGQPSITKAFKEKSIDEFFDLFDALEKLALEEPDEFRGECIMRANRCVSDYSRGLVMMIEASSLSDQDKSRLVKTVLNKPLLQCACKGYPFWKLPAKQSVFWCAERLRLTGLARLLARMRG